MLELPALPYRYDALAPTLSEATLRVHHDKHHAKYVEVVNALIAAQDLRVESLEKLIQQAAMAPDRKLFNNAAQAWNHAFFWNCMTPNPGEPSAALEAAALAVYGDLSRLRTEFVEAGVSHFGSGWVWLVAEGGRLSVLSTHDAETVVTRDVTPLLVCDLWEHAYYLDHQNDRAGFLGAWWDRLANWRFADAQFAAENGDAPVWRHPIGGRQPLVIADQAAYEIALEDAIQFMDHPPHPGTVRALQFGQLLEAIARFQSMAPPPRGAPTQAAVRSPTQDLEQRIGQAARVWVREHAEQNSHWSPMIGGDWRHDPDFGSRH